MGFYGRIKPILQDYKKSRQQILNAMNSDDENVVLAGYDRYKFIMRTTYKRFLELTKACHDLYIFGKKLRDEVRALEKTRDQCYNDIERYQKAKGMQKMEAHFTPREEIKVKTALRRKQEYLVKRKQEVDKLEQEYIIKQEELEIAIKDTNLAKSSYYHLTDAEIELFEKQREKILQGIEKYGSISLACQKDKTITMRVSSIMHYAQKHNQFRQDIEIAKQVFKDNLDAEIMDRALNGTVNPVFQKGEYIGDYAVKDNKLLVEVAKAKLPKEYNPRAYAAAHPQGPSGTTINIVSFDGVDETKIGYAKNIGVVKSVDDTGRVERITQAKKMLDFYEKKPGAKISKNGLPDIPDDAIIEAEIVEDKDGVHKA